MFVSYVNIFSTGQEPGPGVTEDITEETVNKDIIVPVLTLKPAPLAPLVPVPVRQFIGEELVTVTSSEIKRIECEHGPAIV